MRILDESTYYWVWSAHGESDSGHYYNRTFVRGMVPCPLPGDIAAEMEAVGFSLTEYVPGEWFSHWERPDPADFRQCPVFKPIVAGDQFPPEGLPERLPDEWVDFFAHYTAGGRLKREYRGE
jgi:hypothetical protein